MSNTQFTNATSLGEPIDGKAYSHELITMPSVGEGTTLESEQLRRDFKPHHVLMFSIACAVGTGLVIGSGQALARGGPGSHLIAYILVGAAVFFVMTAMGEMAAFLPMNKGFSGYAGRMVGSSLGLVNYVQSRTQTLILRSQVCNRMELLL